MTGKIFEASANIYEDQARILFDYYRKVAEQVVGEEERLEKFEAVARENEVQLEQQLVKLDQQGKIGIGVGVVLLVVAVALAIVKKDPMDAGAILAFLVGLGGLGFSFKTLNMDKKKVVAGIEETKTQIDGFQRAHKEIRRDYKVHRIGVAYVPVAGQIGFEGKQFLIDYTGSTQKKEFKLQTVRQGDLFASTINDLQDLLKAVPVVEKSVDVEQVSTDHYSRSIQSIPMYDYLGGLDRGLRTTTFCLEDLETNSVSLPVVFPDTKYFQFLTSYATSSTGGFLTFGVFDPSTYNAELAAFHNLNQMKKALERHSIQFEQVLRNLLVNVAETVQAVTLLKVSTTNKMVQQSNKLLFTLLKTPYNHYSPKLEADEIERIRGESFDYQESVDSYTPFQLKTSSRVLYDPVSEVWVAEDGSKTNYPFGMSQIQEEIVAPMVQNLMKEHRLERLKIYNGIKDQKISYLNKWHQDTEDFYGRNRAESADLINLMRSSFTEFISNYNTYQSLEQTESQMANSGSLADTTVKAVQDPNSLVASYDMKQKEYRGVQEDFNEYMERVKDDIDRRAEKFGFIEYFDASLRDGAAKNMSQAGAKAQDLDPRRKPLLAVNPLFAELSDLPPVPNVAELTATHGALNLQAIARTTLAELDLPNRGK